MDELLSVGLEDESVLVIRIGINILANAVRYGPEFEVFDIEAKEGEEYIEPIVTDCVKFAQGIVSALSDEEEDGTTMVQRMLDDAAISAIENGCEGIVTSGDILRARRATLLSEASLLSKGGDNG